LSDVGVILRIMRRERGLDRYLLEDILQRQHNVIARSQAVTCGMTASGLKSRIRVGGPWQRLVPGVYLGITGTVTADHREMAALLHAGPCSVITGAAAVRRNGIRPPASNYVDVLVPAECRCQSVAFIRIQRTKRMPVRTSTTGQIRFAGAARAVADASRSLTTTRDVRAVVSDAVQKGRCTIADLRTECEQGPRRGSGLLRRALDEVGDGIRSVPEGDLRLLLKRARVPMPVFNARLYEGDTLIAIVDCWWPDAGVAGEVDSREYHYSADDWQRTMRRHDQLVSRGVLLLHFTPQRIRADPDAIVLEILSALAAGCGRPPLPIKALPAD
jgi:hypothetical protein